MIDHPIYYYKMQIFFIIFIIIISLNLLFHLFNLVEIHVQ